METTNIVVVITATLQGGGVVFFLWKIINGLRAEVTALKSTIDAQTATIAVMDKRIAETEKVGELYRKLLKDLPEDLDNYRKVIARTKDEVIAEQQRAIEQKDDKLQELAKTRLREIELIERTANDIPKLRETLENTIDELQTKISAINFPVSPSSWFYRGSNTTGAPAHIRGLFSSLNSSRLKPLSPMLDLALTGLDPLDVPPAETPKQSEPTAEKKR